MSDSFEEYQQATTLGAHEKQEPKPQAPKLPGPESPYEINSPIHEKKQTKIRIITKDLNLAPLLMAFMWLIFGLCALYGAKWVYSSQFDKKVVEKVIYKDRKPTVKIKEKVKWKTRWKTKEVVKWKTKEVVKWKTKKVYVRASNDAAKMQRLKENLATARERIKRLDLHNRTIDGFYNRCKGKLKVLTTTSRIR